MNIINTSGAAAPLGNYPHARRVGSLLFLSGIGPRDAQTNQVPGLVQDQEGNIVSYDFEAECRSVFENVKNILEAAGAEWNQIVDVTVFLTDMKRDFKTFNRLYNEYFSGVNACRTTVEVNALPTPIAVELKVIASFE